MEEQTPSGDVIADQEGVEPTEGQDPSQGVTEEPQQPQDDFYKNKAFELERKYNNTAEELQEIKNILKDQAKKPEQPVSQYSKEQLQAALSNPEGLTVEQQSLARSELRKIEEHEHVVREQKLLEQVDKKAQDRVTRQNAEQQVMNDPRFQEAFVKLPNGQVQWKVDNPLAQMIGGYMNDPRLANEPDALLLAAKAAYTDYTANQTAQQLQKVTRENEKLKGQTMVEGGGRQYNKPSEDPFQSSMETLKRAPGGDDKAGLGAVKAFLRKRDASKK